MLDTAGWSSVVVTLKDAWHICICCGNMTGRPKEDVGSDAVPFKAWLDGPEGEESYHCC